MKGEPSSQRSVAYEKACILFNLAAIYTQIGARHDRKSEKGLDGAVYSFLQAAGVFKHIYDTFTNAPSMDLKPLVLDVFVDMMLAQSRECLYEKLQLQVEVMSIQDADSLYKDLAGEANQLAKKYTEIHTTIQSNETHSYLPECWVGLVPMKAEYYKGLAHFHASKAAGEGVSEIEGYPADKTISDDLIRRAHLKEAIASLEEARRIQRMCRDLKNKDGLSKVVKEALTAAEDEFAVIDRMIPDNVNDDDLELLVVKIEAISNVTLSLTGPDFTAHKVEDPFKGLGPIGVFSARKYWTAPRSIRLQKGTGAIMQRRKMKTCHCKPGTLIACDYCKSRSNNGSVRSGSTDSSGGKERVIDSFGFNVRGDAPVVISHVETNSLAELGGLKQGDYIVEIMGIDVKWHTYQQVVKLINSAHASLELKVVTPMDKGYQSPIPKDPYCPYTYQSLGRHSTSSSMLSSTRTSNSDTAKSQKTKSCSNKRSRSRLNSFTASSWNLFRRSQSMGKI